MARFQSGSQAIRLDGIATPVNADQAANKAYVDASSQGIPAYASSTAYSVGDIVIDNDILYRVNASVSSSNTVAPATNSNFTRLTNVSGGGGGSGIETYVTSTAYDAGTVIYYATDQLLYYVRTAVTSSNTTPPSTNSSFQKIGFLTTAEGESLFQPLVPQAEALLGTLPTGNREITARAQQGASQIRTSSNLNSTTPSWGFFDNLDFGNFPASSEVYSQLTSSTNWSNLFNGTYRYLALNFGGPLSTNVLQALFSGSVGETPIELLGYVDASNYAIWQVHGYSGGAEGNLFYMGLKQPTLVTSQGTVGTSNVRWMFNLTTSSNPVISQFSQQITDNEDVLLSNNRWGKVGAPQLLDGSITVDKLDAPASQSVFSPLTVDHGGLSQDTTGRFRLSPAFTDSAGVLALDMGYVVSSTASHFNAAGTNGQFFFSTNGTATDIATLLANDAPSDWGAVRSIVMARGSNDSPSRSIAGLVNLLNVGSILEVHTNQGDNMAIWTITGVTYVGGDSNINTNAIIFRVEDTPRVFFGHTNSYGLNPIVGLRETLGSINLTTGTGYGIVIHGEDKVKDGTYLLSESVRPRALDTSQVVGAGRVMLGLNDNDMTWAKNIEGIYQGTWRRVNREGNNTLAGLPVGNIGFLDTYNSVGNGTGHFSSAGDRWATVNYLSLNRIEYVSSGNGEDARVATSRLKSGSHIKVVEPGTQNFALFQLGNQLSESNWDDYWEVTVVGSNGNIPSQTTNLTVYIATATDNVIANDHLTDNSISGTKLNITEVSSGTTRVISRNEDTGALEEGPYATFSGSRDGIVPGPTADVRPNPDLLVNAIQTQPLRFTTNTQGIITGARGWELLHNGSVVTTRPTTWAGFDHSSDDVGLWVTTEDLTQAERDRLAAYGTSLDTGTIEMLLVNADDHNSWMLCNMRADLSESGDDTLEVGDLGTGMYVSIGDGNFSVVASQGTPSDNLKFYFPISLTGTVDLSQTTPSTDRFIDASGNWVEPALNTLDTLSMVLETQVTPYRLVGYDTSSPTLKYKQWDTKIDGHIYHYTVFYAFTSGVIQTATVYQGHWSSVPTGDNASSFLFGTRTYTTTSGVTTWTDSI